MIVGIFNRIRERLRRPDDGSRARQALDHFSRGSELASLGRHRAAVRQFRKALKLAPATADLYHHLGSSLAAIGRYSQAIENYDLCLALSPDNADVMLDRGNSSHMLSELDAAIRDYSRAIYLRGGWPEAHANRAVVLAQSGDEAGAEKDAEESIRLGIDPETMATMLRAAREERDSMR